jgi:hypothetical protein
MIRFYSSRKNNVTVGEIYVTEISTYFKFIPCAQSYSVSFAYPVYVKEMEPLRTSTIALLYIHIRSIINMNLCDFIGQTLGKRKRKRTTWCPLHFQ